MVGCHANSIHTQNLEIATVMSFNQNITAILPEEVGHGHVCTKSGRVAHTIYKILYIQNLSHNLRP